MPAVSRAATIVLALGLVLGGCGVRGALENPKAGTGGSAAPASTATADSGQNKPENAAPRPHQGFVLDGLLR